MESEIHTQIQFDAITELFQNASQEKRNYLFEYEVYTLLARSGAETPPKTILIPRGVKPSEEETARFAG